MKQGTNQVWEDSGNSWLLPSSIMAVHELKSPLALIRQLALFAEQETATPEMMQLLQRIQLTAERALRLTSDLSRVSQLQEGLFDLETVNPSVICSQVAREIRPLYQARGADILARTRSKPTIGVANIDLLRRILFNFADNALHYSQNNKPVVINTTEITKKQKIRLSVRDYGPEVSAKTWRNLERNLLGTVTYSSERPESSGLGLYISKQFAGLMRANLGAIRHRDGMTFYVDIDLSRQMRLL